MWRKRRLDDVIARAAISFTNRAALDHAVRTALAIVKPIIKRGVFGQSFATFAYRPAEAAEMARDVGLAVGRVAFLNQTVSPFNTLLPNPWRSPAPSNGTRRPRRCRSSAPISSCSPAEAECEIPCLPGRLSSRDVKRYSTSLVAP
jgi:hypothetical protein